MALDLASAGATRLALGSQADRLAPRAVNVLFQGRLPSWGLRVPVSHDVLAVSSRIVMNNAG
jgi:hypothetical protein